MNFPPMGATLLRYVYPLRVTRTFGRLPEARLSTTFAGTSMPVAVLPACKSLTRNLIVVTDGEGRRATSDARPRRGVLAGIAALGDPAPSAVPGPCSRSPAE